MFLPLVFAAASLAAPDPSSMAADGVLPVARPDHVRAYVDALELDRDQLDTVEFIIEDYEASMLAAHEELLEGARVSRSALDDAFAGRRRLSLDAIRRLREDVESAPRAYWPAVDARLDELVEALAVVSTLPRGRVEAAQRAFRRQVLIDAVVDDGTAAAAATGLNLERLVDRGREAELAGVDAAGLEAAMGPWLEALDSRLVVWVHARRSDHVEDSLAEIAGDDAARLALMKASADRWIEQTSIHSSAIDAISALARASGGEEAGAAWAQRAQEARYPGLYDDHRLRVTSDWVRDNGDDAQREAVTRAHAMWVESCRPVAMKMTSLMRKGFEQGVDLQHSAIALSREAVDLRRTFLQSSGDRQVRLETARALIERHLTEGQRAAVRRVIMDPRTR